MDPELRLLILEDVAKDAELVVGEVRVAAIPCVIRAVESRPDFEQALDEFAPDVILSDFTLPGFDGLSGLIMTQEKHPDAPFIFVSGTIAEEHAIEALRRGATDYVLKSNLTHVAPRWSGRWRKRQRATRKKAEQELRASDEKSASLWKTPFATSIT